MPILNLGKNTQQQHPISIVLATMLVLLPAIGSSTENLLQDTLKSIIVSIFTLTAAVYLVRNKEHTKEASIHPIAWAPAILAFSALLSMLWSHTYLAGVEFSRWIILGILFIVGSKSINQLNFRLICWSIHLGAFIASTWVVLQFWFNLQFFAQGPNPASTFVNRNFFAEFLVCTIPFSLVIILQTKDRATAYLLTISLGFNLTALLMTGTRSALIAVAMFAVLIPYPLWRIRNLYCAKIWNIKSILIFFIVLLITLFITGTIKTQNPSLIKEYGYVTALERATSRTSTLYKTDTYIQGSFSIRASMWGDTFKMILKNPLWGVGAGAWEVNAPLYQNNGEILETDYYAHNELLQLLAEYGVFGWAFLFIVFIYLASAIFNTLNIKEVELKKEIPLRTTALSSIFILLIISNAGFPWRLATTGVLFILSLSILAASDARLNLHKKYTLTIQIKSAYKSAFLMLLALLIIAATYISYRAVRAEDRLVSAIRIGLTISRSKEPNHPNWASAKAEMLELAREGVLLNSHYRKLTPIVADSLASWGDWKNAVWFWESILLSRPYVTAIITNIAKGHIAMGNYSIAEAYINRARIIQPEAKSLAYVDILFLRNSGKILAAEAKATELLERGWKDKELLQIAYSLGKTSNNRELLIKTLEVGILAWPEKAVDGWLKLGDIYAASNSKINTEKALKCYQSAWNIAPQEYKATVLSVIPIAFQNLIEH